ncbi:trimeric intracellular cation channel type 1B.1-like [Amphiura filiformis]|uniref:trimeric intracellular cation channel type 1B.1-like n=1 Tax=Amphiura filiformis TaxID=82378 RepID=UPI003B216F39
MGQSGSDLLLGSLVTAMDYFGAIPLFPLFDWAHFTLSVIEVRSDAGSGTKRLCKNHPLVCWFCSMVSCFAGPILLNFMIGQPVLQCFNNHARVGLATIIWYLVFYAPGDFYYNVMTTLPAKMGLVPLKEVFRTKNVARGVVVSADLYPEAYLIMIINAVILGCGGSLMRNVERCLRGVWDTSTNSELLKPTFMLKACITNAILVILCREGLLPIPLSHLLLYITIVMSTIKISMMLFHLPDPFGFMEITIRPLVFGSPISDDEMKNKNE